MTERSKQRYLDRLALIEVERFENMKRKRARPVPREHILQEQVCNFVARCVDCEHEFAAHDRSAARAPRSHLYEAKRGIRKAWPDTELCLQDGLTFRCELKEPRVKKLNDEDQERLIVRLSLLGHTTAWANSVVMYGKWLERCDVPLTGNWRTVAEQLDAVVLGKIRTEEALAKEKREPGSSVVQFRLKRRGRPTPAQIRRGGMTLGKLP